MKVGDGICLLAVAGVIGFGASFDLRTRKVPVWILAVGGLAVGVGVLFPNTLTVRERLFGVIPGVLLMAAGFLWHLIGAADSALLILSGFAMGLRGFCFFLMISLLCLLLVSLVLFAIRRIGRKDTLPFYPFAAAGLIVTLLLSIFP